MQVTRKPGTTLTDRGDPVTSDFTQAVLTADGAWHDISFASIVPAGTKFVRLYVSIINAAADKYLKMRRNGNSNSYNIAMLYSIVAMKFHCAQLEVWLDTSLLAEYYLSSGTWTSVTITVTAYGK